MKRDSRGPTANKHVVKCGLELLSSTIDLGETSDDQDSSYWFGHYGPTYA